MRRCKDNWVNATQILKCCNFPKAKRTKILEKGVQIGLHEKVQGGFGKFQGTWIPLEDAQKLADEYGVTAEMAPVLYLDVSDPSSIPAKVKSTPKDPTPTKRKYNKKPVKRLDETPTKKYKSDNLYTGISNMNPPFMNFTHQRQVLPPTFQQPEFMGMLQSGLQMQVPQNGQDYQSYQLQLQRMHQQQQLQQLQNQQLQQQQQQMQQQAQMQQMQQMQQQQRQIAQQKGYTYPMQPMFQQPVNKPTLLQSTNETNWSQDEISQNHIRDSDTSISSTEEQQARFQGQHQKAYVNGGFTSPKDSEKETYASQLLRFFSEDNAEIPYFVHEMPYDFDINEPIDDEGHTPLHWAASIGNYQMIHLLLSKGSSPLVVNNFGLNPLSKLISFNNCYELKNFPKVLDDLELSLINTDINGRTPLHYLCQFSKVQSKYESLRYYLQVILEKLTASSRSHLPGGSKPPVDLLKNVLDHQDVNGDTCMHLAIKAGCSKIVKVLLEHGARDDLENIHKQTAKQLIVHYNLLTNHQQPQDVLPPDMLLDQSDISIQYDQLMIPPTQSPKLMNNGDASQIQDPSRNDPDDTSRSFNDYQVLATPVQPFANGRTDTPDTQKTTIQSDGIEEEDIHHQLNGFVKSEENKENIFIDNKGHGSVTTPVKAYQDPHESQQALLQQRKLAVISERTAESTPIFDKKTSQNHSTQHVYKPRPPELDKDGKVVHERSVEEDADESMIIDSQAMTDSKLPLNDLATMVSGMISSLSKTYKEEIEQLTADSNRISREISTKRSLNAKLLDKFRTSLSLLVDTPDFKTIEEGQEILDTRLQEQTEEVKRKEEQLLQRLSSTKNKELAEAIQAEEYDAASKEVSLDSDDDAMLEEEKIRYAIELTNLQLQKKKLMEHLAESTMNFGIDDKMYKYRKLISLSCGLKVEDIDSLIDGIEESLMETVT